MSNKWMSSALVLSFSLQLSLLTTSASAQETPDDGEWELELPENPKEALEKTLGTAMKFNKAAAQAFGIAKAALTGDPFAVVNALVDLLSSGGPPDITVDQARREIIAAIEKTREDELLGKADGQLKVLNMILGDPESMIHDLRLAVFLNDTTGLLGEFERIITMDVESRAETVIHLVPAYNMLVNALALGLSMGGPSSVGNIEILYNNAIHINAALVSDNDSYGGYLFNHIIGLYGIYECNAEEPQFDGALECKACEFWSKERQWKCPALVPRVIFEGPQEPYYCTDKPLCDVQTEERRRFDHDPTVYMIRTNITDHMLALL
jgi:hypothetical protein